MILNSSDAMIITTNTCTLTIMKMAVNLPPRIVARAVGVVNRRGSVPSSSSLRIDCAIEAAV